MEDHLGRPGRHVPRRHLGAVVRQRDRRRRGLAHFIQSQMLLGTRVIREPGRAGVVLEVAGEIGHQRHVEHRAVPDERPDARGAVDGRRGIGIVRAALAGDVAGGRFAVEGQPAVGAVGCDVPDDGGRRIGDARAAVEHRVRKHASGVRAVHGHVGVVGHDVIARHRQIRPGGDLGEDADSRIRRLRLRRRHAQPQRKRKPRAPFPHRRLTRLHVSTLFVFLNRRPRAFSPRGTIPKAALTREQTYPLAVLPDSTIGESYPIECRFAMDLMFDSR